MSNTYQSPYSERYGSESLRRLFSPEERESTWREVWNAVVLSQAEAGLIDHDPGEFLFLENHLVVTDTEPTRKLEAHTKHELVAALQRFQQECDNPLVKFLHLGMTSSDVQELGFELQMHKALVSISAQLFEAMVVLENRRGHKDTRWPMVGRTHGQPAEMTSLSNRLFLLYDELAESRLNIGRTPKRTRGLGGAIGNRATMARLCYLSGKASDYRQSWEMVQCIEELVLQRLFKASKYWKPLPAQMSTQTGNLLEWWFVLAPLVRAVGAMAKFAGDVRLLAMTGEIEIRTPSGYIGSSAMPTKVNPIVAENITALSLHVATLHNNLWSTGSRQWLERSLDDSAFMRSFPEMLLATSEIIAKTQKLVQSVRVPKRNIESASPAPAPQLQGDAMRLLQMERLQPRTNNQHDYWSELTEERRSAILENANAFLTDPLLEY
jgi:adenylosuccinate lyase